jgi:hypothetical protein
VVLDHKLRKDFNKSGWVQCLSFWTSAQQQQQQNLYIGKEIGLGLQKGKFHGAMMRASPRGSAIIAALPGNVVNVVRTYWIMNWNSDLIWLFYMRVVWKNIAHMLLLLLASCQYTGTWFFLQQQYAFGNDTCVRLNYAVSSILMQNIYSVHGFIHTNIIIYIGYLIYLTMKWMKSQSLPHTCVMSQGLHYCQTMLYVACILLWP